MMIQWLLIADFGAYGIVVIDHSPINKKCCLVQLK
jgi:hypothetical protein